MIKSFDRFPDPFESGNEKKKKKNPCDRYRSFLFDYSGLLVSKDFNGNT